MKNNLRKIISVIFAVMIVSSSFGAMASAANSNESEFPSYYSAIDEGYATKQKFQGSAGACWAFAATSCLESDAIMKGYRTKDNADFSEAHLVWTTYIKTPGVKCDYKVDQSNPYLHGGEEANLSASVISGCGLTDESQYPYHSGIDEHGQVDENNKISLMGNYTAEQYFDSNGLTIESMSYLYTQKDVKKWVMEHGGVSTRIHVGDHFIENNGDIYLYNSTAEEVNHDITIIGWDDNFSRFNFRFDTPEHDGAWLCKNSGAQNSGLTWLSYEEASTYNYVGYTVTEKSDNIYSYNNSAPCCSFSPNIPYVYISNIYTVNSTQTLDRVSCLVYNKTASVSFSVYELNNDYSVPVDGKCIFSSSTFDALEGYCSINANNAILRTGHKYSVIAKITPTDGKSPKIALENIRSTEYHYEYERGQSFMGNGSDWSSDTDGNCFVNMFTSNSNLPEPPDTETTTIPATTETTTQVTKPTSNTETTTVPSTDPVIIPSTDPITSDILEIRNYNKCNNNTYDYKTTITFHANYKDISASDIHWYVNGNEVGTGSYYRMKEATESYTIYCKAQTKDGKTVQSQTEQINIRTSFFAKLTAFFRTIFDTLSVMDQ